MMANPEVKLLASDGVLPSEKTIVDGSYPVLISYHAVTKAGAERPRSACYLLDWLATGDDEKALRTANYIPRTAGSAGR